MAPGKAHIVAVKPRTRAQTHAHAHAHAYAHVHTRTLTSGVFLSRGTRGAEKGFQPCMEGDSA